MKPEEELIIENIKAGVLNESIAVISKEDMKKIDEVYDYVDENYGYWVGMNEYCEAIADDEIAEEFLEWELEDNLEYTYILLHLNNDMKMNEDLDEEELRLTKLIHNIKKKYYA